MAIAADCWVETISGRVRANELAPGDYVFGMDGLPTKVKSVQTYVPQKFYNVKFSDGCSIEGDQFLNLPVKNWVQRMCHSRHKGVQKVERRRHQKYRTPEQILESGLYHTHHNRLEYTVDTIKPLDYGYEDHAVPPFIAGMWCANRRKNNKYPIPSEHRDYLKAHAQRSKQFVVVENKQHIHIRPSVEAVFLRDYATIPTKEFPYKYLYGKPEQRLEFLQGFFITRPKTYIVKKDRFRIRSKTNRYIIEMIQVLCESLGIKTTLSNDNTYWELTFKTKLPILPFQKHVGRKSGERYRQIVGVEECEPRQCVHIETTKPIAVGNGFIPIWHSRTNNKKS